MFERVVFAGGGHRCWWQAGWWETVAPRIGLAPRVIAGVSAGAATACLVIANESSTALRHYRSVLGADAKNAYWDRWRQGRAAIFPHEQIYREALHVLLGGDHFARLQAGPEIRVAFARPPVGVPVTVAVGVGLMAYNLEKYLRKPLHPTLGRRLGFRGEYRSVQSCATESELVDLIIASSCTPPFTAIQHQFGRPTIDGGMVDNVPVDTLDDDPVAFVDSGEQPADTLVLVTRRYPGYAPVFRLGRRVYVQPTEKVAASSWDYTSPAHYEATDAQGRRDAGLFLRWLDSNNA